MRILTLNCHSWMEDDQEEKIKIIANAIKENDYDVIALQEVNQSIKSKLIFDNVKEDNFAIAILKQLKNIGNTQYKMFWDFCHIGFDIYEEGLCILSKHEIVEENSFFISNNKDREYFKTRKIVKASIEYENKIMDFYCCHLGWWEDEEESFCKQVDKLLKMVNKDRLTIFMGDFNNNALRKNEGYDYLISVGIYDTFNIAKEKDKGITVKGKIHGWDKNIEELRLDLILVNQMIEIKKSKVIFNDVNWKIVSDHFGVEIEI